ncbi:hypothetical protein GGS26DRAFT_380764 [Hypomontagnella submonticulosa]|nr:hypothetical protein GGS26DRAFT_380764 [Hypomontagnella submonticulosa]
MSSSTRLKALLAMPASLRLALLSTPSRIRPTQRTLFLTGNARYYASSKYPNIAAFLIPEFRTAQPTEITPDDLFKTSSVPSAADNPLQDELATLFTKNPPLFQYGESDFYKLKKNTRVPEVCILGRSNVGKSSFVNALANRNNNVLAYVSSKAGKTRAINTYGFGPAPSPKDIASQAAEYKGKEDIPTHAFYLVDMPGYGHASLKEWGHNITLYLTKRVGVKGAIVLIDAEVGPKQTDLYLLELLSSAGKRTAIVLTKADKVKGGINGLRDTCIKLWDAIREIENKQKNESDGWPWEREIFVTAVGARDHAIAASTVTTARLAVARLAGLVRDNRPKEERNQKWSGKVVSFEDLQYMPSMVKETLPENPKAGNSTSEVRATVEKNSAVLKQVNSFADIERASMESRQSRHRIRPRAFGSMNAGIATRAHARAFHTGAKLRSKEQPPSSKPPSGKELRDILDDFVRGLKFINTTSNYARDMRRRHDRQLPLPPGQRNLLETGHRKQAEALRRRYSPDKIARIEAVKSKRILLSEEKERMRERRRALRRTLTDKDRHEDWPENKPPTKKAAKDNDEPMTVDKFKNVFESSAGIAAEKRLDRAKKKKQGDEPESPNKEGDDEIEAKFFNSLDKL